MTLSKKERKYAEEQQLSEHFTLYEMIKSAKRPDLVVIPDESIIAKGEEFAKGVLEPLRAECHNSSPLRINSWYRNAALNAAPEIGGVKHSIHQIFYMNRFLGVAADIVPADIYSLFAKLATWSNSMLKKVILYPGRGFIHVDSNVDLINRAFYVKIGKDYKLLTVAEAQDIKNTLKQKFSIKV